MALTKNVLYTATIPKPSLKEFASAQLVAVDPGSGMVLRELPLPTAPVFDGIAAAGSSLYITLRDRRIARFVAPCRDMDTASHNENLLQKPLV